MKTKIFITVVLAALITVSGFAQAPSMELTKCNVDVQLTSKNLILVRYQNADNDKVKIRVYDADNNFIIAKTVAGSGNMKVYFDMNELPTGDYIFKVYGNKKQLCSEKVTKLSADTFTIPQRIIEYSVEADSAFLTSK